MITAAEQIQRLGARAVIAGFKTVSLAVAEAEAALAPVTDRWAKQVRRFWVDMHTLPSMHALHKVKLASARNQRRFVSPMQRTVKMAHVTEAERIESVDAFCLSPWKPRAKVAILPRDQAEVLPSRARPDRTIFARASNRNGRVGIGVAYVSPEAHSTVSKTLGSSVSLNVHHGELAALYEACQLIDNRWPDLDTDPRTPVWIFSSSRTALQVVAKPGQQAGQWMLRKIYELLDCFAESWRPRVVFRWLPDHGKIAGSELARDLARKATQPDRQIPSSMKLKSAALRPPPQPRHERRRQFETRTTSLEQLQTEEQRLVLDTVAQIRKCGLDGVLSLPQIVVCGDQSAGKSSVLEAITEIPFPRNDNLCTRFATEITLRRAVSDCLRVHVIPDRSRPKTEQTSIEQFSETISDFGELPRVMGLAMTAMGLDPGQADSSSHAFARDILSIEIEGPSRPQLTLVDVPGLIQTETKGVTRQDRDMVNDITDFYISQPRTICLAVVSATNDYANQPILTKVREVDPTGERTLGIITKPDRLDHGSGSEAAFLALAQNEDIFFKLGWHVIKNRKYEETAFSFEERNASEAAFFRSSNFKALPADNVGIEALRVRLSLLLFEHVKRELPNLRRDLEKAISDTTTQLNQLGASRATPQQCRTYLTQLSMTFLAISKAAIDGHYEADYFQISVDDHFSADSAASIRRLRAVIQHLNQEFTGLICKNGAKYHIVSDTGITLKPTSSSDSPDIELPCPLSKDDAIAWIERVLKRSRGKEPIGNYNPLVIGELFWELSCLWPNMAKTHVERVYTITKTFFDTLLREKCPKDVHTRLSAVSVNEALRTRCQNALNELEKLIEDCREFPITYNHYYTDTIQKKQAARFQEVLDKAIGQATIQTVNDGCHSDHMSTHVDTPAVVAHLHSKINPDMVQYSCESLLDCVQAMYKDQMKTFVQNVTTQAVERHMVRDLDKILSPLFVSGLSDEEVVKVVSEPSSVKRQREFLSDRLGKLNIGQDQFRDVMGVIN